MFIHPFSVVSFVSQHQNGITFLLRAGPCAPAAAQSDAVDLRHDFTPELQRQPRRANGNEGCSAFDRCCLHRSKAMNASTPRRIAELAGMLAVGDGVIAALAPTRHLELWRGGPRFWDSTVRYFEQRPTLSRIVAGGAIAVGVWLMLRQVNQGSSRSSSSTELPSGTSDFSMPRNR
jgi:hypothetical protein